MHELFADWYAKVDLEASPDLLARRWACVEGALKKLSSNLAIELARTFLDLPPAPTRGDSTTVSQIFKAEDASFPMMANGLLVRVLAGATLAAAFSGGHRQALDAALATLAGCCSGAAAPPLMPEVVEAARRYVATVGAKSRVDALVESKSEELNLPGDEQTTTVPQFQELTANQWNIAQSNFGKLAPWLTQADKAIRDLFDAVDILAERVGQVDALARGSDVDRVAALREECEILWWLFGAANDDGIPFSALQQPKAAIACALELAARTRLTGPVPAARAFLERALRESSGSGKLTLASLLDGAGTELCTRVARVYGRTTTDTWAATPVVLAATKGAELKHPGAWVEQSGLAGAFEARFQLSPQEWALQLYYELLLCRALGTPSHG